MPFQQHDRHTNQGGEDTGMAQRPAQHPFLFGGRKVGDGHREVIDSLKNEENRCINQTLRTKYTAYQRKTQKA